MKDRRLERNHHLAFSQNTDLILSVAALIYLTFHPIMAWVSPNPADSWLQRLSVSGPMLLIAWRSRHPGLVSRHLNFFQTASLTWLSLHYYYLTWASGFENSWFLGVFVTMASVAACMLTVGSLRFYSAVSLLSALAFTFFGIKTESQMVAFPSIATVIIACYFGFISKLRLLDELARSSRSFENLFDSSFDGLLLCHPDGRILAVNDTFCDVVGESRSEILGAEGERAWTAVLEAGRRAGRGDPSLLEFRRRDGLTRSLEVMGKEHLHDGQVILFVVARDVTERERGRRELEERRARMVSASHMAAVGQMASGVAHEINNPLGVIQGISGALLELQARNALQSDFLEASLAKISRTVGRIAGIVRSLQTLSRDAEQDPRQLVELGAIIEETLGICREKFRNAGVELRAEPIPAGIGVLCRPNEISQVLLNLLNNAFDAVEGLEERWVGVKVRCEAGKVEILVEDSGPGVPEEHRERILEPFFTTKPVGKGTGLGLSISRVLLERHSGRLRLDEAADCTRFIIELPSHEQEQKLSS